MSSCDVAEGKSHAPGQSSDVKVHADEAQPSELSGSSESPAAPVENESRPSTRESDSPGMIRTHVSEDAEGSAPPESDSRPYRRRPSKSSATIRVAVPSDTHGEAAPATPPASANAEGGPTVPSATAGTSEGSQDSSTTRLPLGQEAGSSTYVAPVTTSLDVPASEGGAAAAANVPSKQARWKDTLPPLTSTVADLSVTVSIPVDAQDEVAIFTSSALPREVASPAEQLDAENDARLCVPYEINAETFDVPLTCPDDRGNEADEYWCPGKPLRVAFITWNMAHKPPKASEVASFGIHPNAHIVVVGTQENGPYIGSNRLQRQWVNDISRACLQDKYTLVNKEHMWAMHLAVFARSRDVAQYVSHPERSHVSTGLLKGIGGNKGGIAVAFALSMVPQPLVSPAFPRAAPINAALSSDSENSSSSSQIPRATERNPMESPLLQQPRSGLPPPLRGQPKPPQARLAPIRSASPSVMHASPVKETTDRSSEADGALEGHPEPSQMYSSPTGGTYTIPVLQRSVAPTPDVEEGGVTVASRQTASTLFGQSSPMKDVKEGLASPAGPSEGPSQGPAARTLLTPQRTDINQFYETDREDDSGDDSSAASAFSAPEVLTAHEEHWISYHRAQTSPSAAPDSHKQGHGKGATFSDAAHWHKKAKKKKSSAAPPSTFMTFLCITAHLAAHQGAVSTRNMDYRRIVRRLKVGSCGKHRSFFKKLLGKKRRTFDYTGTGVKATGGDGVARAGNGQYRDQDAEEIALGCRAGSRTAGSRPQPVSGNSVVNSAGLTSSSSGVADALRANSSAANCDTYDDNDEGVAMLQVPSRSDVSLSQERGNHRDATEEFDVTIFGGDLNYRIDGTREAIEYIIEHHKNIRSILINNDQLTLERARGSVFHGFQEGALFFRPTYKYEVSADSGITLDHYNYSSKRNRMPAYCDRVLYKKRRGSAARRVAIRLYTDVPNVRTSDHRPVVAIFDIATTACTAPSA